MVDQCPPDPVGSCFGDAADGVLISWFGLASNHRAGPIAEGDLPPHADEDAEMSGCNSRPSPGFACQVLKQ